MAALALSKRRLPFSCSSWDGTLSTSKRDALRRTQQPVIHSSPARRRALCLSLDSSARRHKITRASSLHDASSSSSGSSTQQSAGGKWSGYVFGQGPAGSWDCGGVGRPVVRRYPNREDDTWFMWYEGRGAGGSRASGEAEEGGGRPSCVGLALSANGLVWTRGEGAVETNSRGEGGAGMVLQPSSNWWCFDTRHVGVSDLLMMASPKVRASAGVLWMFYEGYSHEELDLTETVPASYLPLLERCGVVREGVLLRSRIGLALSNDARNFARIEGDHHSGAVLDVGPAGEWDSLLIGSPHVVFHSPGDLRMYYHALEPSTGQFSIGAARSRDGIRWAKLGKVLTLEADSLGCMNPQVMLNPGIASFPATSYIMLYEQVDAQGSGTIFMAVSEDGIGKWSKKACVLEPNRKTAGAWDSASVGTPCLVDTGDGGLRMYYSGRGEDGTRGIGVSESVDGSLLFSRVEVPTYSIL